MLRKKYHGVDTKLKFFVFSLTRSISGVSFTVDTLPFMFLRSIWYWSYREKNKSAVNMFHNDTDRGKTKKREENRKPERKYLLLWTKKVYLSVC